jgi:hypothetical protein
MNDNARAYKIVLLAVLELLPTPVQAMPRRCKAPELGT